MPPSRGRDMKPHDDYRNGDGKCTPLAPRCTRRVAIVYISCSLTLSAEALHFIDFTNPISRSKHQHTIDGTKLLMTPCNATSVIIYVAVASFALLSEHGMHHGAQYLWHTMRFYSTAMFIDLVLVVGHSISYHFS